MGKISLLSSRVKRVFTSMHLRLFQLIIYCLCNMRESLAHAPNSGLSASDEVQGYISLCPFRPGLTIDQLRGGSHRRSAFERMYTYFSLA